jgi:hypothetical protein
VPSRVDRSARVIVRRRGAPSVNVAIYGQGLVHLVRHPSVIVIPLLAAVADALVSYWGNLFTNPLGGTGSGGLLGMVLQILYLFAFGAAIVHANNIVRGYRGGFDASWEETRGKIGGILLAAIGFQFITWAAAYVGSILGSVVLQFGLQLIAMFFLIMTIPAAAIGGLPGQFALSGSIRAVRSNWPACLILAVAFVLLWIYLPSVAFIDVGNAFGIVWGTLAQALARAIVLGYLAFPFAVTYDETAFRGPY